MIRPTAAPRHSSAEDDLLDELLALSPGDRRAWLDRLARASPAAAARLSPLLDELEAGDDFLAPAGAMRGPLFDALCGDLSGVADEPLLSQGDRLGPYVVGTRVGRGGMGEVYRARDEQLGRDVALKVLPSGGDEQRLSRLRREARLLAALNHPNIGAIYGLVSDDDVAALVLEFVEGPTLAERLKDGALPLAETLSAARQLVEALDAARARRIVHCDLKPSNIAFARDGRVKVLDFGIATVWRGDPAASSVTASGVLALSGVEAPGAVVGTAAYMSPEQVRGDTVGHRSDIWAFGCVLYEMLSGARAFAGDSTAEVLARVLERAPDLELLPATTPPSLRVLVARCLEKDPNRRLERIADARPLIQASEREGLDASARAAGPTGPITRPGGSRLAFASVTLAVLAAVVFLATGRAPAPVSRLTVPLPAADELVTGAQPAVAFSPDGRTIVYRARREGELLLFRRHLDDSEPSPLPGTVNAVGPFISPDGRWVGFHQDGVLMKVPLAGGTPSRLAQVGGGGASSSWGDGGAIVVAPTPGRGLLVVAEGGGTAAPLTLVDAQRGERAHDFPEVLPGGRTAIFTVVRQDDPYIAAVDLSTGAMSTVTQGRQARYLPGGYLLVVRGDALWAAPFDASRAVLTGDPRPVLRGFEPTSAAQFAVTLGGSLVYVPPRDLAPPRSLVWIDRTGHEQVAVPERRRYLRSSLSPDGSRVAFVVVEGGAEDLWVEDIGRGTLTRLTHDPEVDTAPVWSPDGRSIVFRSDRDGGGLFRVPADGSAAPERLTPPDGRLLTPYAFTPDGLGLLFTEFRSYRDQGIGRLSLGGDRLVETLVDESFTELRPALSPDGGWLAYQADPAGRFEVFVRGYPDVRTRLWQVSTHGGLSPQWSPDGRELFYYDGQAMVSVKVGRGDEPFRAAPERLFDATPFAGRLGPVYSVSPDGRRFLFIREEPERDSVAARRHLLLVQNWKTELASALASAR